MVGVERFVGALSESGLYASASSDIASVEWSKFVGWSGISAAAVLTRLPTNVFLRDPDSARLAARIMRETASLAARMGVRVEDVGTLLAHTVTEGSEDAAVAALQAAGERLKVSAPDLRQSILQDADRGRRLEVDETLGATLSALEKEGLPAPTLAFACAVLRAVSRAGT